MSDKDLIKFQGEYITLLERVAKESAVFLFKHGYLPNDKDVEEGTYLRAAIRIAKSDEKEEKL